MRLILHLILASTISVGTTSSRVVVPAFLTRHVLIFNNMTDGQSFTVHCKSADDDLGVHNVGQGQLYQFKFHSNFFGTTLFYCSFRVGSIGGVFDVFKNKRDIKRCPEFCKWYVVGTGVQGYREDDVEDIYYHFK
ncbi:hypothetical protein MLD38_040069 [Melastoma candidum]|uniref:Uncharacterized protein n=1 Tax=Melastoma candidum TaxID=119954 RepID=A0ACB9L5C7_9MYRT|nr:hypothetical protein MLD38_040069 [Melastoma candidum]